MGIHLKEKDVERFNSKIIKASDENQCWLWNGTLSTSGYGQFQVRDKCVYAHRAMYAIKFGEIPENGHVCHKCDNPKCVMHFSHNVSDADVKSDTFCPPDRSAIDLTLHSTD